MFIRCSSLLRHGAEEFHHCQLVWLCDFEAFASGVAISAGSYNLGSLLFGFPHRNHTKHYSSDTLCSSGFSPTWVSVPILPFWAMWSWLILLLSTRFSFALRWVLPKLDLLGVWKVWMIVVSVDMHFMLFSIQLWESCDSHETAKASPLIHG